MTNIRSLMLAAAFMASQPVDAAACHRYSRWYYPWPQRCGAARQMVRLAHSGPTWRGPERAKVGQDGPNPPEKLPNFGSGREKAAIELPTALPLPGLARADFDGGEADEPTRAKILLRAALEAPR